MPLILFLHLSVNFARFNRLPLSKKQQKYVKEKKKKNKKKKKQQQKKKNTRWRGTDGPV